MRRQAGRPVGTLEHNPICIDLSADLPGTPSLKEEKAKPGEISTTSV